VSARQGARPARLLRQPLIAAFAGDGAAQVELTAAHRAAATDFPAGIKRLVAERFGVGSVTRVGS
jgi:4-hydroxy-tetrahydrodipicolinate synthase